MICSLTSQISSLLMFSEVTGLRQSIPFKLCANIPNFRVILDLESLKCHDYYCFLIKQKLEKPSK